eukprot:bmy_10373T0
MSLKAMQQPLEGSGSGAARPVLAMRPQQAPVSGKPLIKYAVGEPNTVYFLPATSVSGSRHSLGFSKS